MIDLTLNPLDERIEERLRSRAKAHGRSVEQEILEILREALCEPRAPSDLAAAIRARIASCGGVDLELPPRTGV